MRSKLALTTLCAAALALSPQSARADWAGSGCGGQLYTMCASWSLTYIESELYGNYYSLVVTNTTNAPVEDGNIKEIALGNLLPGSFSYQTITALGGDWGSWAFASGDGTPFSGQGLANQIFLTTTAGNTALGTGASLMLNFAISGAQGTFNPDQIAFHEISGPNGCSTKAVFNIDTGVSATDLGAGSELCGSSTIPEPTTVVLVATGLVGIMAARRRRRATTEN